MVLPVTCKKKEKEDMATNLRTRFKDKQRKRLSESITVNSLSFKRPYSESLCSEPVLVIAPVLVPSTVAASTNLESNERLRLAEGTAHQEPQRPFSSPEDLSDDSAKCVAFVFSRPKSSRTPNREEITELMRQIISFTEREAPVHNMGVLFSAT